MLVSQSLTPDKQSRFFPLSFMRAIEWSQDSNSAMWIMPHMAQIHKTHQIFWRWKLTTETFSLHRMNWEAQAKKEKRTWNHKIHQVFWQWKLTTENLNCPRMNWEMQHKKQNPSQTFSKMQKLKKWKKESWQFHCTSPQENLEEWTRKCEECLQIFFNDMWQQKIWNLIAFALFISNFCWSRHFEILTKECWNKKRNWWSMRKSLPRKKWRPPTASLSNYEKKKMQDS